ncbi:Heat shock protein HslJ [Mariniphaga anaerophila]|uniref:Heat shock protein HslJ n=1 Tax=Mariniphaga anaerophila TaxID=1484053 RepID=A0A1M4YF30_9BACT|nr:copper resistance protein NlpE N-terminal domain-containing protein [Mariniphaga anaerophila]SHF04355.1 Heat shock protein HslJ [Mariniphaga anaerophila]
MKTKTIFLITFLLAVLVSCNTVKKAQNKQEYSMDTSRNSLDWAGTYAGFLPCADCEGIQTEITLSEDLTYTMALKYTDKDETVFQSSGKFEWDKNGSKITLKGKNIQKNSEKYLVGENQLFKLDMDGNRILGDLAANYILRKRGTTIVETYWKLVELRGKKIDQGSFQNREPHLILKVSDNRVFGNAGCNNFNGTYELLDGNQIKFSPLATTRMACPEMELESEFLNVLQTVDNYNNNGDELILNKARMAPLAKFKAVYLQ